MPPTTELPTQANVFTVAEFCEAHRISKTSYYEMKAAGLGPAEMIIGRARRISFEAAAKWRKAREKKSRKAREAASAA
jgi:hypothetical protein